MMNLLVAMVALLTETKVIETYSVMGIMVNKRKALLQ